MEIKRVALVLVDISGYTRFMKLHAMSLLHVESIITELLEAVIDPGPPLPGTDYGALSGRFNRYAVRRILGGQPPRAFLHLPNPTLTPLQLWSYFVMGIGGNVAATIRHRLTGKR